MVIGSFACAAVEIPLPNEQARMEIMKIHAAPIAKHGEIGLWCLFMFLYIFLYIDMQWSHLTFFYLSPLFSAWEAFSTVIFKDFQTLHMPYEIWEIWSLLFYCLLVFTDSIVPYVLWTLYCIFERVYF